MIWGRDETKSILLCVRDLSMDSGERKVDSVRVCVCLYVFVHIICMCWVLWVCKRDWFWNCSCLEQQSMQ